MGGRERDSLRKKQEDVLRGVGKVLYLEWGNVYDVVYVRQNSLNCTVKMCVFCKLFLNKIDFFFLTKEWWEGEKECTLGMRKG